MKYFFILGNNPTLSLAELYFSFRNIGVLLTPNQHVALLETEQKLEASKTIKKLGGTIKIGLLKCQSEPNAKELIHKIEKMLKPRSGKFKFGLSYYGQKEFKLRSIGMAIKTNLKDKGYSVRFVTSREKNLSSVVVEQNKLATKGQEIILIENNNKILLGQTLAVQPFKELSFRDYGRPARDDRSGMLPPKLAQIMINLSQTNINQTIFDPFCGSGTILSEAVLIGYKNAIGSDISEQAIINTKKNIEWTQNKFSNSKFKIPISQIDVKNLSHEIKANSIDAIITEPYLGPQRGKIEINKIIPELEKLYNQALIEFKKILKLNGKIIMVWPRFHIDSKIFKLNPDISNYKTINPVPKKFADNKFIKLTERNTLLYGRRNQRVWREIIILQKI